MLTANNQALEKQAANADRVWNALRSLLEAMSDPVLVVDRATRIVAVNSAAVDTFARRSADLESLRLTEVVRDTAVHQAAVYALSRGTASELRLEYVGPGRRAFRVRVRPVNLDDRSSALVVFEDLTQIERLERVRQEFLSNISHELRTPLTSIIAFVETLEDGSIDDPQNNRRFLEVIRRNAERMKLLIADVLELSMIESGSVSIHPGRIDLRRMVGESLSTLSAKAADREVTLVNNVEAATEVIADPGRLEQMLINLIDNGIKFNRPGGSVTVSHSRAGSSDLISITDTGEGIMPDHLERIFERLYRGDRGRTREVGGTGLGLAIVKHLARLHGGEVSVSSSLGEGATFVIELPAA
jgi:two-component system phosphate regulon sensor histidine kinase PhoR